MLSEDALRGTAPKAAEAVDALVTDVPLVACVAASLPCADVDDDGWADWPLDEAAPVPDEDEEPPCADDPVVPGYELPDTGRLPMGLNIIAPSKMD